MSEHPRGEFDDERGEGAPPPSDLPAGLPPTGQRLPRRLPTSSEWPESQPRFAPPPLGGDGIDDEDIDQDDADEEGPGSGAHRAFDPDAPVDNATSIISTEGLAEYAREQARLRGGPAQPNPWDSGDRPAGQAPPPPLPGRGAPPRRPRPTWPGEGPRPEHGGQRFEQGPPGQWPPTQRGWDQAQGSAANWNYTDSIRAGEFVPTRRLPPSRGWRRAIYLGSGKVINPGQSPDERYQDELVAKCRSLLRGKYKIGVLGKGGAGKSTTAAGVGSIFAELRQDDRVVAIDADTAFGKLTSRIDPSASGSYWELAGDRHLHSFADIRSRVGSNAAGLFVLGGDPATARRRQLEPDIYRQANILLDRHFTLSIVDCGSTLDADITLEVLGDVDALIVVSSPWYDGASAAGQTLEWLANNGYTGLLNRTVVVINDSDGHATKSDLQKLAERFGGRGQKVIQMPYDEHLRPGGVVDVQNEVNKLTRRRFLELAAACAEHFASTTDSPRGYQ
jgi:MinD-like ATPase involved in chromosome partitioning or flagellar assembly